MGWLAELVNAAWDKVCWVRLSTGVCITTEGCLARDESIPLTVINSPRSALFKDTFPVMRVDVLFM